MGRYATFGWWTRRLLLVDDVDVYPATAELLLLVLDFREESCESLHVRLGSGSLLYISEKLHKVVAFRENVFPALGPILYDRLGCLKGVAVGPGPDVDFPRSGKDYLITLWTSDQSGSKYSRSLLLQ